MGPTAKLLVAAALASATMCGLQTPTAPGTLSASTADSLAQSLPAVPTFAAAQYDPLADPSLILCLDNRGPFYKDAAGTQPCANGDSCAFWGDRTTNGYNAVGVAGLSKPVYQASSLGGAPGLQWQYQNKGRLLSLGTPAKVAAAYNSTFTMFLAVKWGAAAREGLMISRGNDNTALNVGVFGGKPQQMCCGPTGAPLTPGAFFTYAVTQDTLPNHATGWYGYSHYYQNGAARMGWINQSSAPPAAGPGAIVLGDYTGGTAYYNWDGAIYAVMFFDRALTPAEVFQLDQQVRARYSQAWPGDASDKIIIWDGNSISQSGHIPNMVAQQLGIPYECIFNLSWGGKSTSDQLRYFAQEVEPFATVLPAGKQVISLGWEITNDLGSPSNAFHHSVSYGQQARALGWEHVVGTCLPRIGQTSFETNRKIVNDSIRAYSNTFADAVVDVASDPLLGVNGLSPNPNPYYGDGVHPTPAGDTILVPYFVNVLRALGTTTGVLER